MAFFRSVWNRAKGEFETIPEKDYHKTERAKDQEANVASATEKKEESTAMSVNGDSRVKRDTSKPLCKNGRCKLITTHRQDGVESCEFKTAASATDDSDYGGGTGSYSYYGGGSQSAWSKCRHEPTACFHVKKDDVTYYGGSDSKVTPHQFDGLVVCLLGRDSHLSAPTPPPPSAPKVRGKGVWNDLAVLGFQEKPWIPPEVKNYLTIDWPDYGVPPVQSGFWLALHEKVKAEGIKNVLFFCMGGHGRTGTALASMLLALYPISAEIATTWVHEHYCKEAIEGSKQKEYLGDLAKVNGSKSDDK